MSRPGSSSEVDMREEICPECGGDGYLVYVGGPGHYSSAFGNYLPSEECVRCSFCGGSGLVEVEDAVLATQADQDFVPGESPGSRAA